MSVKQFEDILGVDRLKSITTVLQTKNPSKTTDTSQNCDDNLDSLYNSKSIECECKTLILRPHQAKLIVPTDKMKNFEKDLMFLQKGGATFGNLVRGCYWLVDDMYKFEQMGYTKEVHKSSSQTGSTSRGGDKASEDEKAQDSARTIAAAGLRYLACAECNLCPLGWYDPTSKESYLYVW